MATTQDAQQLSRPAGPSPWRWLLPEVGAKRRADFYRQLANVLDTGVPVQRAVELASRSLGPGGRRIRDALLDAVKKGDPLYTALERFPHVFPWWHLAMIRASEETGTLPRTLRELAVYTEEGVQQRRAIISELTYPFFVFVAFCFIPPFPALFLGQISMSQYLARALTPLLLVFGVVFAIYAGVRLQLVSRHLRLTVDSILNAIPVLGPAIAKLSLARFALILRSLYVAGLTLDRALEGAGQGCGNEVFRRAAERAAEAVRRGESMYRALAETRSFPPQFLSIIESGEEAGRLDEVLDRLYRIYSEEGRHAVRVLSKVFTTVLYLIIVVMVAIYIIRFWLAYVEQIQQVM